MKASFFFVRRFNPLLIFFFLCFLPFILRKTLLSTSKKNFVVVGTEFSAKTPIYVCNTPLSSLKSQDRQDQIIFSTFFNRICGGTFIEMGAADGIQNSNTYAFEMDLKWKGLLIDASPKAYKKLVKRTERKRSIMINGAVGDQSGTVTYIDLEGYSEQISCIKEFASDEHIERIDREMKLHPENKRDDIEIPIKSLSDWLKDFNLYHVNFFSLDVEGAELQVLKGIDYDIVLFDVILVEISENKETKQKIIDLLGSKGYMLYRETYLDGFFCRRSICPLSNGTQVP